MKICATCAVEYDEPVPSVCPICADERQYLPVGGQRWTDLDQLATGSRRLSWTETEPGLVGIAVEPSVGIGQTARLVTTDRGSLLWDPTGYLDEPTAQQILRRGPVLAIAASHPHMFGVQIEWSRRLGGAPVLVNEADVDWLGRRDASVELWSDHREITPEVTLHRVGGHFIGSAVALWSSGAGGRGVLFVGDTVAPNPDRTTVGFLRSYPNKIPLSPAVVERITSQLEQFAFDRMIGNFGNRIDSDARAALRRSADRHIAWVRGDYDNLT